MSNKTLSYKPFKKFTIYEGDVGSDAFRDEYVHTLENRLKAIIGWLEINQPDVFIRGLWDVLRP